MPSSEEITAIIFKENPSNQDKKLVQDWISDASGKLKNFSGADNLDIAHLNAESGDFRITPPLYTANLILDAGGGKQDIDTATSTCVIWQELEYNHGPLVTWDSSEPTRIYIKGGSKKKVLLLSVFAQWEANSTGDRTLTWTTYNSSDVEEQNFTMLALPAATQTTYQTFSFPITYSTDAEYLVIEARQTSGVTLELNSSLMLTWFR